MTKQSKPGYKYCAMCGLSKRLEAFGCAPSQRGRRQSVCLECNVTNEPLKRAMRTLTDAEQDAGNRVCTVICHKLSRERYVYPAGLGWI